MPRTALIAFGLLAALSGWGPAPGGDHEARPIDCPRSIGRDAECLSLQDANGAWVVMARPRDWNGELIVHAHGGPRTSAPEAEDPLADLDRFSAMVRAGYAWVGSTYRRPGYGVRMAAEDTENARQLFWERHGEPRRTILHGQSWGGNVAAKASELYAVGPDNPYDGVLITNGVVSGGTRAYQFRADLRAVYQYFCGNHPSREDGAYPVWQGLPKGARMRRDDLRERIVACTGVGLSSRDRTAAQSSRKRQILAVTGIKEDELISHMTWATFLFQDLVHERLGGRNPFDNSTRVYSGSDDDDALNAGVERFRADPEAVAQLADDADMTGLIETPTITIHALHDPTVSYAAEAIYARTVAEAGRAHLLVQAATDEGDHSKLEDASYLTALAALEEWLDTGERPDSAAFQARCLGSHPARQCRFVAADQAR